MDEEYKKDLENLKFALTGIQQTTNFLLFCADHTMPHHINFDIINKKRQALKYFFNQAEQIYIRFNETPEKYQHIDDDEYFHWEMMQAYKQYLEDRKRDNDCAD